MQRQRRRPPELVRPFTPTEQRIALALMSDVDYDAIGAELGGVKGRTIRGHVEAMAQKIIGCDGLEPKHAVVTYFLWLEWSHGMTQRPT